MSDEKEELTFAEAVERFAATLVPGTPQHVYMRAEAAALRALVSELKRIEELIADANAKKTGENT